MNEPAGEGAALIRRAEARIMQAMPDETDTVVGIVALGVVVVLLWKWTRVRLVWGIVAAVGLAAAELCTRWPGFLDSFGAVPRTTLLVSTCLRGIASLALLFAIVQVVWACRAGRLLQAPDPIGAPPADSETPAGCTAADEPRAPCRTEALDVEMPGGPAREEVVAAEYCGAHA